MRDDEVKGLAVRITARGVKAFVLEKLVQGRVKRWTIGRYGDLTLDEARVKARKEIVAILDGRDPVAERQDRRVAPTFKDLETAYLERHAIRKVSQANDRGVLNHHLAHLRPRRLTTITRDEIARLHLRLGTEPSSVIRPGRRTARPMPRQANAMLTLLRCMFNCAIDWGLHPGPNPCLRIKKFPEISRDRFVTPDELPRLWVALQHEPNPYVRVAFIVGLLTGARRSEVLTMQWGDLDVLQGLWRIPETKPGRVHLVPLPRSVLDELLKLPRLAGNPYVFVGRWGKGHLVNIAKPWERIKRAAGLDDVRIHDLRRTLGSWLVAAGASLPLIGRALNHSNVGTTAIYARLQLDPVRAALESNATRMLTVIEAAAKEETPV